MTIPTQKTPTENQVFLPLGTPGDKVWSCPMGGACDKEQCEGGEKCKDR